MMIAAGARGVAFRGSSVQTSSRDPPRVVAFGRDAGDVDFVREYAERLARIAPDDRDLAGPIQDLRRKMHSELAAATSRNAGHPCFGRCSNPDFSPN